MHQSKRKTCHVYKDRRFWTDEEDEILKQIKDKEGLKKTWKEISKYFSDEGRSANACVQRWKKIRSVNVMYIYI